MDMRKTSYLAFAVLAGLCSCRQATGGQAVRTVAVTRPETTDTGCGGEVSLPGIIKEGQTVRASFKTGGQICALNVGEGDYVGKGQLIAVLDTADYQIALDAARARHTQLSNEAARVRTLYEHQSVSKNEYEKAAAGLDLAAADLRAKENQLQYTRLLSPVSGYVRRVDSHVGEMVDAGSAVVELIDVGRMEVEVELPYAIYRQRDSLRGFVAVLDGREYPLARPSIIPKAGSAQQYTMLLTLPSDGRLREASGLNVEVRFGVGGGRPAQPEMTVPESAIVYDGPRPGVWVLGRDSAVARREIRTGTLTGGRVSVTGGLDGSETIVRAGAGMLHEGERVRVLQRKSSTNPGGLL